MSHGLLLLMLAAGLAALVGVVLFGVLRFFAATRGARRRLARAGTETVFLSTALQEAVGKLKAQEERMRTRARDSEALGAHIVECLGAGLLVVDEDERIEILNPAGCRLLGLSADVVGRPVGEALSTHPALLRLVVAGLVDMGAAGPTELSVTCDGRMTHLSASVSPLAWDGGARGVVCLLTDVTAIRELEEQLRLKYALARLGELTAGIAHEFRNGLATIHGYSRLLRPEALPELYRPYVDGIRSEAETLGAVMTNFLKYARPEQMTLQTVDLEQVVRRAVGDVGAELGRGVHIEVQGAFAQVEGDEVLLRQVFANLVRNAGEACASAPVGPVIRITGTVNDRTCQVVVEDNGPGIPEGARVRVFEPFFTTRTRGTGLGLAIVQKVVVMHNGRVSAGDSPLGGAAVALTFPVSTHVREIASASTAA